MENSSQRSIKRKRFDDEIIQYSVGVPSAQVNRIRSRRQSQASANSPNTSIAVTTTVTPPALSTPEPFPAVTTTPPQITSISEPPVHEPAKASELLLQNNVSPPHQVSTNTTPVSSPTVNSAPMIPQTPSIPASTATPTAVASPAPRKLHKMPNTNKNRKKSHKNIDINLLSISIFRSGETSRRKIDIKHEKE